MCSYSEGGGTMKIFAMALTAVLVSAGVLRAQKEVGYASGQAARLL